MRNGGMNPTLLFIVSQDLLHIWPTNIRLRYYLFWHLSFIGAILYTLVSHTWAFISPNQLPVSSGMTSAGVQAQTNTMLCTKSASSHTGFQPVFHRLLMVFRNIYCQQASCYHNSKSIWKLEKADSQSYDAGRHWKLISIVFRKTYWTETAIPPSYRRSTCITSHPPISLKPAPRVTPTSINYQ